MLLSYARRKSNNDLRCGAGILPAIYRTGLLPAPAETGRLSDSRRDGGARAGQLSSQNHFGNSLELHEGGAFVDFANLRVAQIFLDRVVFREPIAAVNLDRL